jgi:hypothetical protein
MRSLQIGIGCLGGFVLALAIGCAKTKAPPATGAAGNGGASGAAGTGAAGVTAGAAGTGAAAGAGGGAGIMPMGCQGKCTDFPAAPIIEPGVPTEVSGMFTVPSTGAGPCITEPEDGALFPNNWLRPRVKFRASIPGTVREIRFHADLEAEDLVAYTMGDSWVMPKSIWLGLAQNVRDQPITVTVRELGGGESSVKFSIAPVPATGSIIYWAADPAEKGTNNSTTSTLEGFAAGDEATTTALRPSDVQMQTRQANNALRSVKCIGCHTMTPDGDSVAFIDLYPWNMAIAQVKPGRTGLLPDYVTPGGADTIRQPGMGIFSFSEAHWTKDDRIAVSPYYLDMPCGQYRQTSSSVRLAWLDLGAPPVMGGCPVEGLHFGYIAREGDTRSAANPTWSHDGETIVYSSTAMGQDGRLETGPSDLYQVPYAGKKGGAATPLPFAADPDAEEYYPAFSPDDKLVVFDRVPAGGVMFANPMAELWVVAAKDATKAYRLEANDPPKCTGLASPGVNNHWAKWAPGSKPTGGKPGAFAHDVMPQADGKTYYWLIFSSNRYGTPPVRARDGSLVQVSQLYATAIVVSETTFQMYPAIYLWNQSAATLNTTPAWDRAQIPVVQ